MIFFEQIATQSKLIAFHPFLKVGLWFCATLLTLCTQSLLYFPFIVVLFLLICYFFAAISVRKLMVLLFVPFGFIAVGCLSIMIEINATHYSYAVELFGQTMGVNANSLLSALYVFVRSMSCVVVLYALVLNTPLSQFMYVLRKLKVPDVILELMIFTSLHINLLLEAASQLFIAQQCRLGHQSYVQSMQSVAKLGASAFVLSTLRITHMHRSMVARAYTGEMSYYHSNWKLRKTECLVSLSLAVSMVLLFIYLKWMQL